MYNKKKNTPYSALTLALSSLKDLALFWVPNISEHKLESKLIQSYNTKFLV